MLTSSESNYIYKTQARQSVKPNEVVHGDEVLKTMY